MILQEQMSRLVAGITPVIVAIPTVRNVFYGAQHQK
jgi:hypothetical protein